VFVLGNLLMALANILSFVISIYIWLLIAHAVLSWIPHDPMHPIPRTLARIAGFVLDPIRRLVPMQGIGIDLSPLLAILLLWFTNMFLVGTLRDLAIRM
jgi:YggT family protein